MSTLGTQRTRVTRLSIPEAGQWRADVTLEAGALPSGRLTLTIGTLTAIGTVARAAYDSPQLPHAALVGGIGWDAPVSSAAAQALSMFSDAGVRLSSVLTVLANAAGEPIEQPTDRTIAFHWSSVSTRTGEAVLYRDVLTSMVRLGLVATWWVGLDGVTRFTARTSTAVTGRATFLRGVGSVGLRVYGTDDPAPFLPAAIVDGEAISRAVVYDTPESLTVECWGGNAPTLRTSVLRMVANAFPSLVYGYPRTYLVAAVNGDDTLDLVPPPVASGYLRDLRSVPQWNTGGLVVTPALGAEVAVSFLDADPERPVLLAWAPGVPVELLADADDLLELGPSADAVELAGGGPAVARVGDAVEVGELAQSAASHIYWRGTPGGAWTQVPPGTGPGQVPVPADVGLPITGTITSGSAVVSSG